MKNIKKLAFCILLALVTTLPTTLLAQTQTFIIDNNHKLTFEKPNTFTTSVENDNNLYFDSIRIPPKITAVLLNKVFISDTPEMQKNYIENHKKKVQRAYNVYVKEGTDNVLDYKIPYIIFADPDLPVTNKLLYLTHKNKLFMMTISFENDAPLEDIEDLIEKIAKAINNNDNQ